MLLFKWKPLELFASENQLISIRYEITGSDGENTVKSEGNLTFQPTTVTKSLPDLVETDLIQWIEKDTTIDGVNLIKSNLEEQLTSLKLKKTLAINKVDFPWLSGTFTIE
jgi:hypothetical protein